MGKTTDHTTGDTGDEGSGTSVAGVELGFRCDEKEDGALGGGFDPSPGNESLVDFGNSVSILYRSSASTEVMRGFENACFCMLEKG